MIYAHVGHTSGGTYPQDILGPEKTQVSSLATQIAGNHYKKAIQPIEYIHANGLGFVEGNVIKYVTRWKDKNGIEDLKKAKHYLEILIELTTREGYQVPKTEF